RVERQSRVVHAHPFVDEFGAPSLADEGEDEGLRDRLDGEGYIGITGLVHGPDRFDEAEAEPIRIRLGEDRDVVGDLTVVEPAIAPVDLAQGRVDEAVGWQLAGEGLLPDRFPSGSDHV